MVTEIIEKTCEHCGAKCAVEVVSLDEVPEAPECPRCGGYLWKGIAVNVQVNDDPRIVGWADDSWSDDLEDTAEVETIILEEAEEAKRRLLLNQPAYIELYRRVTFNEQGVKVEHLDAEDFESEWAEVNIPLHEGKTVYCVVCYIVGHPANQPAVAAMVMLNTIARELVHGTPGIIRLEGK